MIIQRKSKTEFIAGLFCERNFLICLMVTTFIMFASGSVIIHDGAKMVSVLIGSFLFAIASAMLVWAWEISKKRSR